MIFYWIADGWVGRGHFYYVSINFAEQWRFRLCPPPFSKMADTPDLKPERLNLEN